MHPKSRKTRAFCAFEFVNELVINSERRTICSFIAVVVEVKIVR